MRTNLGVEGLHGKLLSISLTTTDRLKFDGMSYPWFSQFLFFYSSWGNWSHSFILPSLQMYSRSMRPPPGLNEQPERYCVVLSTFLRDSQRIDSRPQWLACCDNSNNNTDCISCYCDAAADQETAVAGDFFFFFNCTSLLQRYVQAVIQLLLADGIGGSGFCWKENLIHTGSWVIPRRVHTEDVVVCLPLWCPSEAGLLSGTLQQDLSSASVVSSPVKCIRSALIIVWTWKHSQNK